jgi:hypothetical protein
LLENMRDFKGMKRQRSRNRGGGGGKPQHNANRAFESNGPDGVKIRGAAQHVFEKYQQLARDALTAGDRVLAESYQQHAEHYFRVLRAVQPQRLVGEIMNRDAFASGYDIDFEDESGADGEASSDVVESDADRSESRGEWRRDERPRDDRPRDRNGYRDDRGAERQRDDRPRDDRPRDDRPRDDRPRDDRPREDRVRDDRPRDERPRSDRNDRYRDDRRFERNDRNSDPLAVVEPQATPLIGEASLSGSPILRSQDGGVSQAPAFLQARSEPKPEADGDGENRTRSRRRRGPRGFDGDEPSSPVDVTEDA